MNTSEQTVEKALREMLPLYDHIGLRVESVSGGIFRCCVPLNKKTVNHFHTVHAALQWASAELLGGLVVAASGIDFDKYLAVVKRYNINFLAPAVSAVHAEARFTDAQMQDMLAHLKTNGRCDFELDTRVLGDDGALFAEGHGVYAIRSVA